ncbi:MAG TPA: RNA polymerase sigma factor [Bryobacteraceae bacterium]|jgi:RNA polymerase sigma-70 factor (ECF subfamily)
MTRYQQADKAAAGVLIDAVSPRLFRFFLGCVGDRSHAEDLLQDFWLRMHAARRSYRPPEPVLPWLYAIARRVRVDDYRRRKRVSGHEVPVAELPEVVAPAQQREGYDFAALLGELPESQQEVIVMLKVSGLTLEEVAAATRTSVGAVKQKAHRAYERLRSLMRKPVHGSQI